MYISGWKVPLLNDCTPPIVAQCQLRALAQLSTDGNGNVKIECPNAGKKFAAEEISALVLRKLIDDSAKFLNDKARWRLACVVA